MTSDTRPADEIANLVTHGGGFLLSLGAAGWLMSLVSGRSAAIVIACGIYSAALILVYGSSTLSHSFHDIRWRRAFRTLDQACIFLLISGTFTPFAVLYLDHGYWWILLAIMWMAALAGILRVLQVRDLSPRDKLCFGVLGFLPVTASAEFSRHAPAILLVWIIAGGACYCLGAPFLKFSSRIRYSHAAWHLFVIAGSACHYHAVLLAVTAIRKTLIE
jgi:hemolysin III